MFFVLRQNRHQLKGINFHTCIWTSRLVGTAQLFLQGGTFGEVKISLSYDLSTQLSQKKSRLRSSLSAQNLESHVFNKYIICSAICSRNVPRVVARYFHYSRDFVGVHTAWGRCVWVGVCACKAVINDPDRMNGNDANRVWDSGEGAYGWSARLHPGERSVFTAAICVDGRRMMLLARKRGRDGAKWGRGRGGSGVLLDS